MATLVSSQEVSIARIVTHAIALMRTNHASRVFVCRMRLARMGVFGSANVGFALFLFDGLELWALVGVEFEGNFPVRSLQYLLDLFERAAMNFSQVSLRLREDRINLGHLLDAQIQAGLIL